MSEPHKSRNSDTNRLLSEYGELYLLLEADPKTLHEAIFSCSDEQLLQIMKVTQDNLFDYQYDSPADLDTAQQFLSVWFMACRAWDRRNTPEGTYKGTYLEFEKLDHDHY